MPKKIMLVVNSQCFVIFRLALVSESNISSLIRFLSAAVALTSRVMPMSHQV